MEFAEGSVQKEMTVGRMGSMVVMADFKETPPDKINRDRIDDALTEKAESRQTECWADGCSRHPHVWVREVRFDLGESGPPMHKASVDSSSYDGPIPGFCIGHLAEEPAKLATAVYFGHEAMTWGFRPSRYFVIFTDGTHDGGICEWLNPTPERQPITKES